MEINHKAIDRIDYFRLVSLSSLIIPSPNKENSAGCAYVRAELSALEILTIALGTGCPAL